MTINGAIMQLVEMRENSMMPMVFKPYFDKVIETISECEEPHSQPKWIPVSERLPCDGIPVNITWVNRKPVSYYVDIKDKHFTSTGIYYRGKWFWYSWACEDLLYEYGNSKADAVDEDVEIIAWMPLPEPWKGEEENAKLD